MRLRQFLDAAYALIVEAYQQTGVNLLVAMEKALEFRAGTEREAQQSFAAQNDASLAELERLMSGVRVSS